MKQSEYLYELRENLEGRVSQDVLKDILLDYESFFVSGREDGKTDDEISNELGSPAFLAKSLLGEHIGKETLNPEVLQQDKHIANPGRRLCAYLIDGIIAIIPTLILSIFIGTIMLPYLLFITYPSPVVGALGYMSYSAFTTYSTSGVVSTYEVKSVREFNESGEQVIKEDNVVRAEKAGDHNLSNGRKPLPIITIMATLSLAFYLFYSLVCSLIFKGQTIGKKIMRIRVLHSNTKPIRSVSIFCREFLGKTLINSIPIISLISLFTILFTKEHKALHDMLTDTIVSDI